MTGAPDAPASARPTAVNPAAATIEKSTIAGRRKRSVSQ